MSSRASGTSETDRPSNKDDNERRQQQQSPGPPRIVNGMVEFPLGPVNPHLTCELCTGYFRDPVTITECLHTFCKSCLYYAFRSGFRQCPTCHVPLGTVPHRMTLEDRRLQELIDKVLFPGLSAQDAVKEREFYADRGIPLKPEFADAEKQKQAQLEASKKGGDSMGGGSNFYAHSDDQYGGSGEAQVEFVLKAEQCLDPYCELPQLSKPVLCTSGRFKIMDCKKYLQDLLKLGDEMIPDTAMEIRCNGSPVGNELSLTFIARTIWCDEGILNLTYRLSEDYVYTKR